MEEQLSNFKHIRAKSRRAKVFGLAAAIFFSALKPAGAEIISLTTIAAAASLISTVLKLFDSGTDPEAIAASQTREIVISIHERLDGYDKAIEELLEGQIMVVEQIRKDLSRQSATQHYRELLSTMQGINDYLDVVSKGANYYGDPSYSYANLERATDTMMLHDDIYFPEFVSGMALVLRVLHIDRMDNERNKRINLDTRLTKYTRRLESMVDLNHESSLANRSNDLEVRLCRTGKKYFVKTERDRVRFANEIMLLEFYEYLLAFAEYTLSEFTYGPWSFRPNPAMILEIPEEPNTDQSVDTIISQFVALRYLSVCL